VTPKNSITCAFNVDFFSPSGVIRPHAHRRRKEMGVIRKHELHACRETQEHGEERCDCGNSCAALALAVLQLQLLASLLAVLLLALVLVLVLQLLASFLAWSWRWRWLLQP
jgi:hypothetical protein